MTIKCLLLVIFLLVASDCFSVDRQIKAGSGSGLVFKTNGNNTRMSINSAGSIFLSLFPADRILFTTTSGEVTSNTNFTYDGSTLAFPLADATILIGNGSGVAIEVNPSGDVDISNTGVMAIQPNVIIDGDISGVASIDHSKMNPLPVSLAMFTNSSGIATTSTVTSSTEIDFLNGVTSAIQTQLDAKLDEGNFAVSGNVLSSTNANGNIDLDPNGSGAIRILDGTTLEFSNTAGTFFTKLKALATLAADYTLIWPPDDGNSGQFLSTDGAGTMSWVTSAGGASFSFTTVTKSSSATLATSGEDNVIADATSGAITLTLPAASGNNGLTYKITKKDSSANDVIIDGNASETIDGLTTLVLQERYGPAIIASDGTNWFSMARPPPVTVYFKDAKAAGTSGGSFTNDVWVTRDLNTLEGDSSFATLSSNQFVLPAGQYHISWSAPVFSVFRNISRLRNITNNSTDITGSFGYAPTAAPANVYSFGRGFVTLTAGATTYEIQHRCTTNQASNGFGNGDANIDSHGNVYTQVEVTKVK